MKRFFLGCAVAALATSAVYAQETTSSIRGTVTSGGTPIANAAVVVTHVPSGTRNSTTTDAAGAFSVSGLRPGGPYTVAVTAAGYGPYQVTDVDTVVAQAYDVPVELTAAAPESNTPEIVVNAARVPGARTVSQGPATVLTSRDIANIATVNRDIRDLSRRDPFARLDDSPTGGRAISFAGQNARYNRFSVDGVPITDNFGLNTDGLPSRRSPIPLDAIGQFQAKVAPYDVREGNFQGGAINIILKSGTNEFHGTGFYSRSGDEFVGSKTKPGPGVINVPGQPIRTKPDGTPLADGTVYVPKFKVENYGAEIAGPIIKDKVFFMIAGERLRGGLPIAEGPADNNAGISISTISQALVNGITDTAKSKYGYDTGGVLQSSGDKDDRIVGKIDANLSDTQRLSLTGTYAKDQINLGVNNFTSTPQGLSLASNDYIQGNRLYTGVAQLNSEWSDEFSTEVRGFYKDYVRLQAPVLGTGFAQFQVCGAPISDRFLLNGQPVAAGTPGALANPTAAASISCPTGSVYFGPDISRQTNQLTSNTWGGLVQARLHRNDHDLRIFTDIQRTQVFNSFLQRSAGDYYFDSVADFAAGNAQRFRYGNAIPSLVPDDAAAKFQYMAYTFGIQDTWRINSLLTLSYGARYDLYGGHSQAPISPSFLARYGFANNAYLSGRGVFQPRIGFDFKPAPRLSLRGGVGIFSGGTPDVYVSNSFSNTGVLTNSIDIQQANGGAYSGTSGGLPAGAGAAILTNVNGSTIPSAANDYLTQISGNVKTNISSTSTVNALDPHFKIPSQWRATLSADYKADLGPLGDGWEFGGDLFYSKVRNQVYFTDLRVRPNGLLTPDGRPRYNPVTLTAAGLPNYADTNSDIYLTNTSKGRSYIGVARIRKSFDFGLEAGGSFVYEDIKDQAPATSSTAGSNYLNGAFVDPNNVAYGTSNDEVKYNFKYDITFDHAFFGDYKSTIALFGETRIGRPYSYSFFDVNARSAVFGTIGSTSGSAGYRYLLYVPTGVSDPNVSFNTTANAAAFDAFVNSSGLSKYRGKVAPRNAFNSKWFTRFDLHLAQEVPTFVGRSRITVFADVENLTNLINKKWGQIREYVFPYTIAPVKVQCLTQAIPTGTGVVAVGTSAANNPGNLPTVVATNAGQACVQYRYTPNNTDTAGNFVPPSDTIYSRQSLYTIRVGVKFSF